MTAVAALAILAAICFGIGWCIEAGRRRDAQAMVAMRERTITGLGAALDQAEAAARDHDDRMGRLRDRLDAERRMRALVAFLYFDHRRHIGLPDLRLPDTFAVATTPDDGPIYRALTAERDQDGYQAEVRRPRDERGRFRR